LVRVTEPDLGATGEPAAHRHHARVRGGDDQRKQPDGQRERTEEVAAERNVSPEVAARYKRAALAGVAALGQLLLGQVPELGEQASFRLAGAVTMMAGALWPHAQPTAAMLAAYAADPELAAMRLDFTRTLREAAEVLISGLLARSG
jgi:hypothetical protein